MIIKQCNNDAGVTGVVGVRLVPYASIPANPSNGDLWFATDTGEMYIGGAGQQMIGGGSGGYVGGLDGGKFDPPIDPGTEFNFDGGIY